MIFWDSISVFEGVLIDSLPSLEQHASSALQASEKARNQSAKAAAARRGWQQMVIPPAPQSLTWNLKISPWKRRFLLESITFRFHVKLGECIYFVPHQRQVLPTWSYILNEFNHCVFHARSFREELWNNSKHLLGRVVHVVKTLPNSTEHQSFNDCGSHCFNLGQWVWAEIMEELRMLRSALRRVGLKGRQTFCA